MNNAELLINDIIRVSAPFFCCLTVLYRLGGASVDAGGAVNTFTLCPDGLTVNEFNYIYGAVFGTFTAGNTFIISIKLFCITHKTVCRLHYD